MMIDLDKHLTSCSPNYDVYTFNFNKEEVEEIREGLIKKSWVDEVRELLKNDRQG